jgi:hypothetical protein
MLVIRIVDPARSVPVFWGLEDMPANATVLWEAFCRQRGLVALAAEQEGELVGFAVAESHPQVLCIFNLEGDTRICLRLLSRLVRLAGERDLAAWLPLDRTDLRRLTQQLGFVRAAQDTCGSRPSLFYYWDRNG